jgi:tetratricopeptide (TPR) repeat protein
MIRGDDDRGLQRFLAEAEAIAAVHDPHVLRVYEFGRAGGRAYLALELCPGGTLADRLRRGPKFTTREAVTLVVKVARGVAAAHAAGVVHRDLKPGNVLFDAAGEPKVSDFGLAKRVTGADLTATQAVMGSPAYMAPEQARGDSKFVGPQADVWALGVLLYELLAGKRPFAADDTWSLIQKVIRDEPVGVRTVNRDVPADLDTVIKKCLAKGPFERYATAAELADDLDRWLAGVPVSARPAAWPERTLKWVKRNPLPTALAASLVAGTAASVGFAMSARTEAGRARVEEGKKDEALAYVTKQNAALEHQLKTTFDALNKMTDDVIKDWLAKKPELGPAEKRFIRSVIESYDAASQNVGAGKDGRLVRAMGLINTARLRVNLRDFATAEANADEAKALIEAGPMPAGAEPEYWQGQLSNVYGSIYLMTGRPSRAIPEFERVRDYQAKLRDEDPSNAVMAELYGGTLTQLASLYRAADRFADATKAATAARDLFLALGPTHPQVPTARGTLATVLQASGQTARAVAEFRESAAEYRALLADARPGDTTDKLRYGLAATHLNLGQLTAPSDRTAAQMDFLAARDLGVAFLAEYPKDEAGHVLISNARKGLGECYLAAGATAEAEAELKGSRDALLKVVGLRPGEAKYEELLAAAHNAYGTFLRKVARRPDAATEHRASLALHRKLWEADRGTLRHRSMLAGAHVNLAIDLHEAKDPAGAKRELDEALPHHEACLVANPKNAQYRLFLRNNRSRSIQVLLDLGDPAGIPAVAEQLMTVSDNKANDTGLIATWLAKAVTLAREKKDTLAAERYADLAMKYLKASHALRPMTAAALNGIPEFAALKERADFKAMVAGEKR